MSEPIMRHTPMRLEVRDTASDGRTITGVAVPYDEVTDGVPGGERFARGAFRRSLNAIRDSGSWPKLFVGHQHSRSAVGKALTLEETRDGLEGEWRLANTEAGREAAVEVAEGVLDSLSVGFRAIREGMADGVREVREARLIECSLVSMPAYEGARVTSVRSVGAVMLPPAPTVDTSPIVLPDGSVWA